MMARGQTALRGSPGSVASCLCGMPPAQTLLLLRTWQGLQIESGAVAAMAETRKKGKYATMDPSHSFQPIAVEMTGVFSLERLSFISALGRRICQTSGEKKSFSFLLQHLAVAIQRGNSACVMGTLGNISSPEDFFV